MRADYGRAVVEHVVDLLEEEGSLRALIEMKPAGDHLLIVNIAVRPDQQGRGIGDRLLHHAERFAATRLATAHAGMYGAIDLTEADTRGLLERALP